MNKRSQYLESAQSTFYDVVVIGGGITGSGIVRDCQLRGMNSLLIDKGDFASGTSSRSGKLIHGGFRYLQYFKLKLVFQSCLERYRLLHFVAPHLVRPTKFIFPFYKNSKQKRWKVAIGLFLYDLLSLFRNIQSFKFLSKDKISHILPGLKKNGLVGGLTYYDCKCFDFRLVIDTLKSAENAGAQLLNYLELKRIEHRDHFLEVEVFDHQQKKTFHLRTKTIVNATGAWADEIIERSFVKQKFGLKMTTGIHIVISNQSIKIPLGETLTLETSTDGRFLYLINFGQHLLIGTTDNRYQGDLEDMHVTKKSVEYLLNNINQYFPQSVISEKDIISTTIGVRPLIGSDQDVDEAKMSRDFETSLNPSGILSITGGKLTTYRLMAEQAVDQLVQEFFPNITSKCQTLAPISGGQLSEIESIKEYALRWVSRNQLNYFIDLYGSNTKEIINIIAKDQSKKKQISDHHPICWAELESFYCFEYSLTLSDIFKRRSQIYYFFPDNGLQIATKVAAFLASINGEGEKWIEQMVSAYQFEINQNRKVI